MMKSSYESVSSTRNILHQYAAVLTATVIAVSVGMNQGWPSLFLPQLLSQTSKIPTTNSDGSWMVAMSLIGLPIGFVIATVAVDRIGRKICILITSPLIFLGWLLIAYSTNVFMLDFGRFVIGIGEGIAFSVLPIYVCEITDKKIRGLLGCCIQISSKFGALTINILGLYLNMRITALVACSVPILHFLTFVWMPESPYFGLQVLRNNDEMRAIRNENYNTEPLATNRKDLPGFILVFTNEINRKAFFIVLIVRFVQQFSGYVAITFYCLTIFNEAGGYVEGSTASIIYFSIQPIAAIVSGILVDKAGRKPLLIISVIGTGFALTAQGLYFYLENKTTFDLSKFGFVPLASLSLYIAAYSFGLSVIPLIMLGEFFPLEIKGAAVAMSNICFSVFGVIVSKFFQIVKDEYGMHVAFFAFALSCALSLIFIVYFVPETKGRTLEEIQTDVLQFRIKKRMCATTNIKLLDNKL